MTINRDLANLVPTITQSGGNVGIGTSSPSTAGNGGLTLGTTSAGKSLILNSSSNGNNGLIRFIDSNGSNALEFAGATSSVSMYGYGSRPIIFWTNGTERLKIPSDSAGITFPATQSASSNANTLDDYEEGSWTPADGSGAGLSITNSGATYIKVGRLVTIFAFIAYPATANGSNASISGLPFALSATEYGEIIARTTAAITAMIFQPNAGGTVGAFQLSASNTNVTNNQLSGASILFCGSYFASS